MKTKFRKLSTGNYVGRNGRYYAFIFKRPHGKWAAQVSLKGSRPFAFEGYHTTSLPTVSKAKAWVNRRIKQTTNNLNRIDNEDFVFDIKG